MTTVQTISMAALTVPVVPVLSGRRSWSGIADDPGDPAAAASPGGSVGLGEQTAGLFDGEVVHGRWVCFLAGMAVILAAGHAGGAPSSLCQSPAGPR